MQRKFPCSCIILAKNAERTLAATLASVSWCEQVIVGDDGSSDATVAIARSKAADVIKLRSMQSFASKRNELSQYAQHGWVLWVDSDEIISPELAVSVQAVLHEGTTTEISGYLIRRMDFLFGRKLLHGETAHTWLLRLVQKEKGMWKRDVHEVWEGSGSTGRLNGELLHTPHPTIEEFFARINAYTEGEVTERLKGIKHFSFKLSLISVVQLGIYPVAKFVHNYIFRLGILDGFAGFVLAYMMSLHSLFVRIKVLEKVRAL